MSKRHDSDFIGRRNFLKRATFVGAAVVAPGCPLEVLMLRVDGTTEHVMVGPDVRGGQLVQLPIPGNTSADGHDLAHTATSGSCRTSTAH